MRELENQLLTLEASKPSAPPALKFKVKCKIMNIGFDELKLNFNPDFSGVTSHD